MHWLPAPVHTGVKVSGNEQPQNPTNTSPHHSRHTSSSSAGGAGNSASPHTATSDVLVLTADGAEAWFQPRISGKAPSARAFHSAAVVGRHMYVFGGHVLTDHDSAITSPQHGSTAMGNKRRRVFFNDLWKLDTESWCWQPVTPSTPDLPPRRDMATLIAIEGESLLLFGGRNEAGRTLGDLWLFDLQQLAWHSLKAGGIPPAPRKMHAAAYVNGRVLVFGGERDNGVLDDLWSLKLPSAPLAVWLPQHHQQQAHAPLLTHPAAQGDELCRWTQIKVRPSPPARFAHTLSVCGGGRLLLMFGGCIDTAGFLALTHTFVQTAETWVLDLASFSWQKSTPELGDLTPRASALAGDLKSPTERMCHTMAALSDGRLLLLGGRKKDGICADSWWLQLDPVAGLPPLSQRSSTTDGDAKRSPIQPVTAPAGATATSTTDTVAAATAAAAPPGSNLLKSLFNPVKSSASHILTQVPQVTAGLDALTTFSDGYAGSTNGASFTNPNQPPTESVVPTPAAQSQPESAQAVKPAVPPASSSSNTLSMLDEFKANTASTASAAVSMFGKLRSSLGGSEPNLTTSAATTTAGLPSPQPPGAPASPHAPQQQQQDQAQAAPRRTSVSGLATATLGRLTGLSRLPWPGQQQQPPQPAAQNMPQDAIVLAMPPVPDQTQPQQATPDTALPATSQSNAMPNQYSTGSVLGAPPPDFGHPTLPYHQQLQPPAVNPQQPLTTFEATPSNVQGPGGMQIPPNERYPAIPGNNIQVAPPNLELQAFRQQVLGLQPVPPPHERTGADQQGMLRAMIGFVNQALVQYGQGLVGNANMGPDVAIAQVRARLCDLNATTVTMQDLEVLAKDYVALALSPLVDTKHNVSGLDSVMGTILTNQPRYSHILQVPGGLQLLRTGDVPLLLDEYKQLCRSRRIVSAPV